MNRSPRLEITTSLSLLALLVTAALVIGSASEPATTAAKSTASTAAKGGRSGSSGVNPKDLPLGDGKVTTSGPRRGSVYACQTGAGNRGGAQAEGPWIHADGTFDLTAKPTVEGSVKWGEAWLEERLTAKTRLFTGDGLPVGATTGEFPIKPTEEAFRYDRNPNSIEGQDVRDALPRHPRRARHASCLPMGPIGIATNGVAIFNALDAGDRDAVAHEVQDRCGGHPQRDGIYHYHDIPSCLTKGESRHRASGLVGYALDGYPIFGPRGHGGRLLTDADLDACHGTTSKVLYEGRWQRIYHYAATLEYPYTVGCFRGTPVTTNQSPRG